MDKESGADLRRIRPRSRTPGREGRDVVPSQVTNGCRYLSEGSASEVVAMWRSIQSCVTVCVVVARAASSQDNHSPAGTHTSAKPPAIASRADLRAFGPNRGRAPGTG